ncbi:MAG: putative porin [Psychrosphaera sp.]|jgi:predicted porin|uniref:Porin n=1 Tax=Psychrosphaera aquimarina TaxID=2044854 RepID=A0ABU3R0Y5_9GAMM|nr:MULTISPECIES: porin [Psychrosphaera]MBU2916702.1 porin [Psychrosphaera sp. F3M07]MDU0113346.1 porin [Psychrosphaera aquimarina]
MKMLKTLIATAIISASISPAIAATDLYGKINVSFQNSDDGDAAITELKSNSSRFGLKGSTKLDGGISLVYQYEFQVDVADNSGSENIKSRNQYIGLKGDFGEVLLGRNDTVLKQSQGKFDIFSDYEGDIKNLGWKGETRADDSITYKSPKFNGVQFGLSYILDEDNDDAATSISATYGDKALKKDKYYAAIAMDSDVKGYDATRLTVGTKVSGVVLGLILQTQEAVLSGVEKSGMMLSAQYKVGSYNLKGQYQTLEDDAGISIGADRKLGKNTKAYVFYTTFNHDMSADESYVALGLEHKF